MDDPKRLAFILSLLTVSVVSLWKWFRKLFGGAENTSTMTSDHGANISGEGEFAIPIQTEPAVTGDPFLIMLSRATKAGALAGLVGAILGLLVIGFALEIIIDTPANAANPNAGASGIAFISMFLVCSGYPLIGGAVGALIGRLSVKSVDDSEGNNAVFRHRIFGGGIAGFAIGILPYLLLWIYLLKSGESLF